VKSRFLRIRAGDCRFFDLDSGVLLDKNNEWRHHQLARKDGFPLVRSDYGEYLEQPGIGTAWDRAVILRRILKASILGVTAAMIVFAIVLVENPLMLFADAKIFADAKAFLVSLTASQDGAREEVPIVQSTAEAQAFPPIASAAPTTNEIAAPLKTADQSQTEIRQAPTESLLAQFQAWAAGQDARVEVQPVQPEQPAQPVQDAQAHPVQGAQLDPVRVDPVQDARAEVGPAHKHRLVRHVKNARVEIRARQNHRARVRREQEAQVRSAQDARAQEQPVQNVRPPTFLESIGLREH